LSNIISTERFDLIPATPEILDALYACDMRSATQLLGFRFPSGWPGDLEAHRGLAWHARALRANPWDALWRVRFIVLRDEGEVVGSINLKGAPASDGTCEIGWGVVADRRRQGIAFEATRAVVAWAFSTGAANRIIATVPPDNLASGALAARLGMERLATDQRDGRDVWCLTANRWGGAA
jgi:RimJ/RimL family protein N-acetyltransferase